MVWDHTGVVLVVFASSLNVSCNVEIAEALALRRCLELESETGLSPLI